jgi:hypothetical protein
MQAIVMTKRLRQAMVNVRRSPVKEVGRISVT